MALLSNLARIGSTARAVRCLATSATPSPAGASATQARRKLVDDGLTLDDFISGDTTPSRVVLGNTSQCVIFQVLFPHCIIHLVAQGLGYLRTSKRRSRKAPRSPISRRTSEDLICTQSARKPAVRILETVGEANLVPPRLRDEALRLQRSWCVTASTQVKLAN